MNLEKDNSYNYHLDKLMPLCESSEDCIVLGKLYKFFLDDTQKIKNCIDKAVEMINDVGDALYVAICSHTILDERYKIDECLEKGRLKAASFKDFIGLATTCNLTKKEDCVECFTKCEWFAHGAYALAETSEEFLDLGKIYLIFRNPEFAFKCFNSAIDCKTKHNDVSIFIEISTVFHEIGDKRNSERFLNWALEIADNPSDFEKIGIAYYNILGNKHQSKKVFLMAALKELLG